MRFLIKTILLSLLLTISSCKKQEDVIINTVIIKEIEVFIPSSGGITDYDTGNHGVDIFNADLIDYIPSGDPTLKEITVNKITYTLKELEGDDDTIIRSFLMAVSDVRVVLDYDDFSPKEAVDNNTRYNAGDAVQLDIIGNSMLENLGTTLKISGSASASEATTIVVEVKIDVTVVSNPID